MSKEKSGNWFKRHKILTGIIVIIVIIGIASSANSNKGDQSPQKTATDGKSDDSAKSETKKTEDKPRLTLNKGWKLDKSNPYMTQVVGTVSNNSDQAINGYIQITFSALDADGANIGDCLANANTVDANGKWKFKAMCSGGENNVETVRFKEITGF